MMQDIWINLIAAAIGGAILLLWNRLIYPSIIEGFVERTRLAPEYRGTLDFGKGPNHLISLKIDKLGFWVSGKLTFLEGRHKGKVYPVKGRYSHSLLTFHYFPSDRESTSQGSATFQRLEDGALFAGYFAYFSQGEDRVAAVRCELRPL